MSRHLSSFTSCKFTAGKMEKRWQHQHQDLPVSAKDLRREEETQWLYVTFFPGDNMPSFQNRSHRGILATKDIVAFSEKNWIRQMLQRCFCGRYPYIAYPCIESPHDKQCLIISDYRMFFISQGPICISGICLPAASTKHFTVNTDRSSKQKTACPIPEVENKLF